MKIIRAEVKNTALFVLVFREVINVQNFRKFIIHILVIFLFSIDLPSYFLFFLKDTRLKFIVINIPKRIHSHCFNLSVCLGLRQGWGEVGFVGPVWAIQWSVLLAVQGWCLFCGSFVLFFLFFLFPVFL